MGTSMKRGLMGRGKAKQRLPADMLAKTAQRLTKSLFFNVKSLLEHRKENVK